MIPQSVMSVERAIFEVSPDGLLVTDDGGLVIDANPAACRKLGLPREALLGRPAPTELEAASSVPLPGGLRLVRLLDTAEQEALLQQILGSSSDIVFLLDREQRHTGVYGAWMERDGQRPSDYLGKTARELLGPEAALAHEGANARALSGETISYEWSAGGTAAGERHFQTTLSPLRNAAGDIIGILGIGRDLTDTIRTREALQRAEARFHQAFQAAPIAMTISRADDGTYVDVNRAACELFEMPRERVLGRTSRELGIWTTEDDRQVLIERLQREGHVDVWEFHLKSSRGRPLDVLMSCEIIELEGQPHILASVVDVTERKRLEAQLRHAQKLDAIGQLAAGVAHDFNNLLAALSLQLGMMQGEELPQEEVQQSVEEMLATVERAASLTRQLLMFGKRESMHKKRHDLVRALGDTEKLLRRVLGEQIELAITKSAEPLFVEGDETMLQQVVMNLCINARDAMPRGGRIEVSLQRSGGSACLRVADDGPGIDPKLVERIFEPFFTTKDVGEGSGLGLSAVHGIVTQHGGSVEFDTHPGRGTTFTVKLPLSFSAEEQAAARVRATEVRGSGRVLLVEDEPMVRRMACRAVRDLGYEVVEACDAHEAAAVWEREGGRFDILFTDMVMPGRETGVDLSRKLRGLKPDLQVIIASGYSVDLAKVDEHADQFTFLSKPYTRPLLAQALLDLTHR